MDLSHPTHIRLSACPPWTCHRSQSRFRLSVLRLANPARPPVCLSRGLPGTPDRRTLPVSSMTDARSCCKSPVQCRPNGTRKPGTTRPCRSPTGTPSRRSSPATYPAVRPRHSPLRRPGSHPEARQPASADRTLPTGAPGSRSACHPQRQPDCSRYLARNLARNLARTTIRTNIFRHRGWPRDGHCSLR